MLPQQDADFGPDLMALCPLDSGGRLIGAPRLGELIADSEVHGQTCPVDLRPSRSEQFNGFIAGHRRVCCGRAGLRVINLGCALQRMDLPSIMPCQFNDFVTTIPSTLDETMQSGFVIVANLQTCSP